MLPQYVILASSESSMGEYGRSPAEKGPRNNSKNSSFFDIGRNRSDLTGDEKVFYEDQCGNRNHLPSQEIDRKHEEEQQAVLREQIRGAQQLQEELEFVNEDMEVILATSSRRMSPC